MKFGLLVRAFLLLSVLLAASVQASQGLYGFETAEQEARFRVLTSELRCPKCQNQAIGDSDAEIAQDMRQQVAQMILQGDSNREIVDFFIVRYGEFVTYHPRLTPQTLLLWAAPLTVLGIGLLLVIWQVRRSRNVPYDEQEETP